MAKILLIKTYTFKSAKGEGIPLGLLYISSALKQAGHEVRLIDFALLGNNDLNLLTNFINEFQPDIAAVTVNTHERFSAIKVINYIKKFDPKIATLVGGPHITLLGREFMEKNQSIDYAIIEDGEKTIVNLADYIRRREEINKLPGIYYRDKGLIIKNELKEIQTDLDRYGHPDLDIIDMEDYSLTIPVRGRIKALSICTSRGCPYRCSFCAATLINYGRIRYHSAQWIVDEIKRYLNRYGNEYAIFFYDDHFLLNKKRVLEFCQLVKNEELKFEWGCYSRVDVIDDEVLQNIREIGCIMLTFGIETGSDKILKLMNKNITSQKIIKVIRRIKSYGIKTRGSFIWGYPGETYFDIIKTYKMIFQCGFETNEMVFSRYTMIYPGTKLVDYLPKEFDWHKEYSEKDLKQFVHVPVYVPPFDLLRRRFTFALFLTYKYYRHIRHFVYGKR